MGWTQMNSDGLGQTGMDSDELGWTRTNLDGLRKNRMDSDPGAGLAAQGRAARCSLRSRYLARRATRVALESESASVWTGPATMTGN